MANTALENEQIVGFIEHFSLLTDPRQQVKVEYPLDEILLLVLCAVLAGANCWVEIAKFGDKKLDFLRRFRPFKKAQFPKCMHGLLIAAARQARGDALPTMPMRWNHRR